MLLNHNLLMRKFIILFLLIISFSNCKSSKSVSKIRKNTVKIANTNTLSRTEHIINYAKRFKGVRYKWGGTTKSGMDCSGLVYESFRIHDVYLPRISRDMAKKGSKITLKHVQKGDLLFFKTKNRRHSINHVGLVIKKKDGDLEFIHSTTSKGVIISSIKEVYWNKAFVEARRVL